MGWLHLIEESFENPSILHEKLPAHKAAGWVRIAFSYSVMLLIKAKAYYYSIEELLGEKEDCSTKFKTTFNNYIMIQFIY